MAKHEKTWQTDGNFATTAATANDQAREILWSLKALLTGAIGTPGRSGLWTLVGSCDGVNAGMDGVDRWGAAFDPSKIVFGSVGAGVARSWIVLRSPADLGPLWLTIECGVNSGTVSADKIMPYLSKVLPTGGTPLARPSSTSESPCYPNTFYSQFMELVAATHRFNLILATTGEFWFTVSRSGAYRAVCGIQKLETRPSDDWPFASFFCFDTANGGPLGSSGLSPIHAATIANRGVYGRAPDITRAWGSMIALMYSYPNSGETLTTKDYTANTPNPNDLDGTYDELPVYLISRAGSSPLLKGRLPDAYRVGSNATEGSIARDPDTGERYASVVSDWWLPWTADYDPIV